MKTKIAAGQYYGSQARKMWDRGKPSPVLIDFIEQPPQRFPTPSWGQRLKVLVTACGRGCDAHGIEINESAVDAATKYTRAQLMMPEVDDYHFGDARRSGRICRELRFIVGVFFK